MSRDVATLCSRNIDFVYRDFDLGCSRALLCKADEGGTLRVSQLTVDHNLSNESELRRLLQLGLDVEKLRQVGWWSQKDCLNYVLPWQYWVSFPCAIRHEINS